MITVSNKILMKENIFCYFRIQTEKVQSHLFLSVLVILLLT